MPKNVITDRDTVCV